MSITFESCTVSHQYIEWYLQYAHALKIEEGYGTEPVTLEREQAVDDALGVREQSRIIIFDDGEPIGAARFIWVDGKWFLSWIFLNPAHRRGGISTALWPVWKKQYPNFEVAPPYSEAMLCFLEKIQAADIAPMVTDRKGDTTEGHE